jgi:hypothetical protein
LQAQVRRQRLWLSSIVRRRRTQSNAMQHKLQIVLFGIFATWAGISTIFILCRGGSLFENNSNSGYGLIWKYSPPIWRKITLWVAPPWIAALIASFFL